MAKRFTDTEKWKKPFIRGLPTPYKLLWFYILDDCNHAGIWEVDMEVASIRIGEPLSELYALDIFGDRVQKISENKWFLADFIFFQYGELNEKNRLHLSVIQILNKYKIKPIRSPLEGAKDKDKDKDKDKEYFGKSENLLSIDLPEVKIGAAIEYLTITKNVKADREMILVLWNTFKEKHSEEKYQTKAKAIKHFFDSLKYEKINGHSITQTSGKHKGAMQLVASLKQDFAARGKENT